MANIVEYIIKLNDRFAPVLDKTHSKLKTFESSLFSVNSTVLSLGAAIAGIGVGSKIISATSDFERFNAVLTNAFGDATKAASSMQMITDIASKTPFEIDKLTESYVKLVNRGFVPTREEIINLGDLASSQGKEFDQLTEALLDAETMEFERLKEFGIKASKEGNKVKMTFRGVTTTMDATGESVRNYVLGLGQVKGISGSMAAISGTLGGRLSNLQDSLTQLALKVGLALSKELKGFIDWSIELISKYTPAIVAGVGAMIAKFKVFVGWIQENKDMLMGLITGFAAFIAIYKTLGMVSQSITLFQSIMAFAAANPIVLIVAAVAGLIAYMVHLYKTSESFRKVVDDLWSSIKGLATQLSKAFAPALSKIWDMFKKLWAILKPIVDRALTGLLGYINMIITAFGKLVSFFTETKIGTFIVDVLLAPLKLSIMYVEKLFSLVEWGMEKLGLMQKEQASGITTDEDMNLIDPNRKYRMAGLHNGGNTLAGNLNAATNTTANGGVNAITKNASGVSEITNAAPKVFNVNIEKLIENFDINTTNIKESGAQLKEMIKKTILEAVTDVSLQMN